MMHISRAAAFAMAITALATAELPAHVLGCAAPEAPMAPPRVRHDVPFNKRAEGHARRMERRSVRAAKSLWLNS